MNRKSIHGLIALIAIIVSGPLYVPLVLAVGNLSEADLSSSLTNQTKINGTEPAPRIPKPFVDVQVKSSSSKGVSPFLVEFRVNVSHNDLHPKPYVYLWDFDGDGFVDHSAFSSGNVKHVYETTEKTVYKPNLTVVFSDESEIEETLEVKVDPIDEKEWHEFRRFKKITYGVKKDGTIVAYTNSKLEEISLVKNDQKIKDPKYNSESEHKKELTFDTDDSEISLNLSYGPFGTLDIELTEKVKENKTLTKESKVKFAKESESNSLVRSLEDISPDEDSQVLMLLSMGGDPDPWSDQGITPFGDYYNNLDEYVSKYTGFLTIMQTDLYLPGRILDLIVKRVYAPPVLFDGNSPVQSSSYSYQDYPWAPIGKGWELGFPWIETYRSNPAYVHLGNGQRYEIENTGYESKDYLYGDYFTLESHSNGNWTLHTKNGIRYNFDSSLRLKEILDTTRNNEISFTYNVNNKILTITDTIDRVTTFSYNGNGQVSSITQGGRVWSYTYSGNNLATVTDPEGRVTEFDYIQDYKLERVEYPYDGNTTYTYQTFTDTNSSWRISNQYVFDGVSNERIKRAYTYGALTDSTSVDTITVKESIDGGAVQKTTEYAHDDWYNETVWNGDKSTKVGSIRKLTKNHNQASRIEKYFGTDNIYKGVGYNKWDNWGNLIYIDHFDSRTQYFSYINTNSTNEYREPGGTLVTFDDNFYWHNAISTIHDLIVGSAEKQTSTGPSVQYYYNYTKTGQLAGTRYPNSDGDWIEDYYYYDLYGNLIESIDYNGNVVNYEYNDTYKSAYLTSKKSLFDRGYHEYFSDGFESGYLDQWDGYYSTEGMWRPGAATLFSNSGEYGMRARVDGSVSTDKEYAYINTDSEIVSATAYVRVTSHGLDTSGDYVDFIGFNTTTGDVLATLGWYYDGSNVVWRLQGRDGTSYVSDTYGTPSLYTWYKINLRWYKNGNGPNGELYGWINDVERMSLTNRDTDNYGNCDYVNVGISRQSGAGSVDLWIDDVTIFDEFPQFDDFESELLDNWFTSWASSGDTISFDTSEGFRDGISLEFAFDASDQNENASIVQHVDDDYVYVHTMLKISEYDLDEAGEYNYYLLLRSDDGTDLAKVGWTYTATGQNWILTGKDGYSTVTSNHGEPSDSVWHRLELFWKKDNADGYTTLWVNGTEMISMTDVDTDNYGNCKTVYVGLPQGSDNNYKTIYHDHVGINSYIEEQYVYNSTTGSLLREVDGKGYATNYKYDDINRLTNITYPAISGTSSSKDYVYSDANARMDIYDERGNITKIYVDGLGRVIKTEKYNSSGLYSNQEWVYEYNNKIEEWTTSTGNTYHYDYDALGDVIKTTNPDNSYTEVVKNYSDREVTLKDEEGRQRVLHYDYVGTLTQVDEYNSDVDYYTTQYTYDNTRNLKTIEDDASNTITYSYDRQNRKTRTDYEDSTYEIFTYDSVGNLKTFQDQNGNIDTYYFDSLNRLVNITSSVGASFIDDEPYRKSITITGSTQGAVTNYQIPVKVYYGSGTDGTESDGPVTYAKVYTASECATDFSDIRFSSSDGETKLDHWRETYVSSSYAIFWVEVPSIPSSPSTVDIYIYYGGDGLTSESNGDNTFVFFDDFESDTVGNLPDLWSKSGDAGDTFTCQSSVVKEGSKASKLHENGGSNHANAVSDMFTAQSGYVAHTWFRVETANKRAIFGLKDSSSSTVSATLCRDDAGNWRKTNYGSGWSTISSWGNPSADTWYRLELYSRSSDEYVNYYKDRSSSSGWSAPRSYNDARSMWLRGRYQSPTDVYSDNMYIRKYASPEPTLSIGELEQSSGQVPASYTEYSYDKNGNVIHTFHNNTKVSYTYDARNRVTNETYWFKEPSGYNVWDVYYMYDATGNIKMIDFPGTTKEAYYEYDENNRVTSLMEGSRRSNAQAAVNVTYNKDDQIKNLYYDNGVNTTYSYDNRGRLSNLYVNHPVWDCLLDQDYTYDDSGSVTQIVNGTVTETYEYDMLDRLNSTTGPWGTIDYTYDARGNRLTAGATSFTYNDMNQLTRKGASDDYTWDDNGNLVEREDSTDTWGYIYDAYDRLIRVDKNDALETRYDYDAMGRMIERKTSTNEKRFIYLGESRLMSFPSDYVYQMTRYYTLNGMVVASYDDNEDEWDYYHFDHIGSVRFKTDESNHIEMENNYEPFGPEDLTSGDSEFKYAGKYEDGRVDLYYFGARFYDPETGRFITKDPAGIDPTNPQTLNEYAYCLNNPHKYVDPEGRFALPAIFVAAVGLMAFSGITAGAAHLQSNPGDYRGALNQGLIAFDVTGMIIVSTLSFQFWALPLIASQSPFVASLIGYAMPGIKAITSVNLKAWLSSAGNEAGAAGLDEYTPPTSEDYGWAIISSYMSWGYRKGISDDFIGVNEYPKYSYGWYESAMVSRLSTKISLYPWVSNLRQYEAYSDYTGTYGSQPLI